MIDDFCWSQSIGLFLKNMAKAFFRVREATVDKGLQAV